MQRGLFAQGIISMTELTETDVHEAGGVSNMRKNPRHGVN